MSPYDREIEWHDVLAVVRMPAEIDVTNADRAREALLATAAEGPAVVIIDMGETTFCDSAGVQAIIAAYRQAAATGIQFMIVATEVARIFTLVGIADLIPIKSTLEAALEASATVQ